ncbi:hypothetical protein VSO92_04525 [Myroides pelagicus]|uniref:hypothetical protein n=1 Tax=Myroides pelagicus TaxID=270914 RepID=UPI002DBB00E4|nr:hypothetical protein [Myroides pelagicus]MEC4113370.1 hypothetical protein [Myroides pelagicus]
MSLGITKEHKYDYEHVRSSEELFMKFRDKMSNEEIAELVNCKGIVKVTLRSINQSKGKRVFEKWLNDCFKNSHNISREVAERTLKDVDQAIARKAEEILSRK